MDEKHYSHASLVESSKTVKNLMEDGLIVENLYFIGISCRLDHHEGSNYLKKFFPKEKYNLNTHLAYDGMKIYF